MEYGRGTRGYAALKLREQGYKTVTSHIMYCTDLRSTCIYNTRGMSNMQLKGGPHARGRELVVPPLPVSSRFHRR